MVRILALFLVAQMAFGLDVLFQTTHWKEDIEIHNGVLNTELTYRLVDTDGDGLANKWEIRSKSNSMSSSRFRTSNGWEHGKTNGNWTSSSSYDSSLEGQTITVRHSYLIKPHINPDVQYGTFVYPAMDGSAGQNPNDPPSQEWYTFDERFINDRGETIIYELGLFDENGDLFSSREYWINDGDMVDYEISHPFPFSAKVRIITDDNGWLTPEWSEPVEAQFASGIEVPEFGVWPDVTDQWVTQEGYDPSLPYDPAVGTDGQQIIDAIERGIGDNRQQIAALRDLSQYMHNSSTRQRQELLAALAGMESSVIASINNIPTQDYGPDFLEVQAGLGIVNAAVTDLDAAIDQLGFDVTGEFDQQIVDIRTDMDAQTAAVEAAIQAAKTDIDLTPISALATSVLAVGDAIKDRPDLSPDILNQLEAINGLTAQQGALIQNADSANTSALSAILTKLSGAISADLSKIEENTQKAADSLFSGDPEIGLGSLLKGVFTGSGDDGWKTVGGTDTVLGASLTQNAANMEGAFDGEFGALDVSGSVGVNNLRGSSSGWPTFTIPVVGLVNTDPFYQFPWLETLGAWSREIALWLLALAFMWYVKDELDKAFGIILTTPQSRPAAGVENAAPAVAQIKHYTVAGIWVVVMAGIFSALVVGMNTQLQFLTGGAFNGLQAIASKGIDAAPDPIPLVYDLFDTFLPLSAMFSFTLASVIFGFLKIPAYAAGSAVSRNLNA